MNERNLQGRRCVALVRCSSPGQIDTSLDAQNALLDQFARDNGMVCVGVVELAGVTGSVPRKRKDIDQIIRRKQEQDDFEVVLVQDTTRLTRAGAAHGMKILYDLRAAGIDLVTVKDDFPEGEAGDMMHGMSFMSGHEQVRSIGYAVARGLSMSQKEDRCAHCKEPPYGIDRLYTDENGVPRHIIRNLSDRTQLKLDPQTYAVLERFGCNPKSGTPAHYLKQKTERIVLVPGDPERVAVVREIYERHYRNGWGYGRIANDLNDRGLRSAYGELWSGSQVRNILMNPVYLGIGLANVITSAVYYARGKNGPVARGKGANQAGVYVRPPTEWVERTEPRLAGLLDDAIKPAAEAKQRARLDALATRQNQRRQRSRHTDSGFLLTGLLRAKQGGHLMTGRRTGKPGQKWRSYAISKAHSAPSKTLPRTMIGADPVEQAVLAALQSLLAEAEYLRGRVLEIVRQQLRQNEKRDDTVARLRDEKETVARYIRNAVTALSEVGQDAIRADLQAWETRIVKIDAEIRRLTQKQQPVCDDPDTIADAVCSNLCSRAEKLRNLPPAALRDVLRTFISKLEVDLDTRVVDVEFAIPDWSGIDLAQVCLTSNVACKIEGQAHLPLTVCRTLIRYRMGYGIIDFAA